MVNAAVGDDMFSILICHIFGLEESEEISCLAFMIQIMASMESAKEDRGYRAGETIKNMQNHSERDEHDRT